MEEKGVRGRYVCVEQLQELEGGDVVEWRLATCGSPGGFIPKFLANKNMSAKIAEVRHLQAVACIPDRFILTKENVGSCVGCSAFVGVVACFSECRCTGVGRSELERIFARGYISVRSIYGRVGLIPRRFQRVCHRLCTYLKNVQSILKG